MTIDGSFGGDNVHGILEDATTRCHLDGAELGLLGQGQTVIEPLPSGGSSYGLAAVEGDYEVRDTPGVDQQAINQSGPGLIDIGLSVAPWLVLALVLGTTAFTTRARALVRYTHGKADEPGSRGTLAPGRRPSLRGPRVRGRAVLVPAHHRGLSQQPGRVEQPGRQSRGAQALRRGS